MKRLILALALALVMLSPALAIGATVGDIINQVETKPKTEAFINGIGYGVQAANAKLRAQNRTQFYCTPKELAIVPEQYFSLLRRYAEIYDLLDWPAEAVGLILLRALIEAFPCPE